MKTLVRVIYTDGRPAERVFLDTRFDAGTTNQKGLTEIDIDGTREVVVDTALLRRQRTQVAPENIIVISRRTGKVIEGTEFDEILGAYNPAPAKDDEAIQNAGKAQTNPAKDAGDLNIEVNIEEVTQQLGDSETTTSQVLPPTTPFDWKQFLRDNWKIIAAGAGALVLLNRKK